MLAATTSCLLAALGASRPLNALLAVGLIGLFILLAVLAWTRLGQAKPISKCVVLSLLAHLLLLVYAYSTHILYGPPGKWTGQSVTIRLRDAADDRETGLAESKSQSPWHQAGEQDAPALTKTVAAPALLSEPAAEPP